MRFTRNNALKNHVEIVHEGKKPWKCSQCPPDGAHDSSFSRVEGLQIHLKNKHGKNNEEIQAMVEEQMSFKCDECNRGFASELPKIKHQNTVHGGQKCKHCDKRFPAGWALKNHIQLVHEKKKPHICHKCGEGFSSKSSMVNHIFDSHKEEELPNIYECFKKCKQLFPCKKLRDRHECILFPIKTKNQTENENSNDSTVEQPNTENNVSEDFLANQSEIDESKFETTIDQGN